MSHFHFPKIILILFSHQLLSLPSGPLPLRLRRKGLFVTLLSPIVISLYTPILSSLIQTLWNICLNVQIVKIRAMILFPRILLTSSLLCPSVLLSNLLSDLLICVLPLI